MFDHQQHFSRNLNVRGLKKSATIAISDLSGELIAQGKTVYRLGLGQSPFPVSAVVTDALRQNAHQKDNLPVQGLRELKEAVSLFHNQNDGTQFDPERVLIGPGSKELMFLLQITYYGDLVVPTPCWCFIHLRRRLSDAGGLPCYQLRKRLAFATGNTGKTVRRGPGSAKNCHFKLSRKSRRSDLCQGNPERTGVD